MGLPETHWALDIGARSLTLDLLDGLDRVKDELGPSHLSTAGGCLVAVCARFGRLLLDCNRPVGSDTMFRQQCDGHLVSLNQTITQEDERERRKLFYEPYHEAIDAEVKAQRPIIVLSIHSFTPVYEGSIRTMEVGVLFNDRAKELGRKVREARLSETVLTHQVVHCSALREGNPCSRERTVLRDDKRRDVLRGHSRGGGTFKLSITSKGV